MTEPVPIRARLFPSKVTMADGTVHDGVLSLLGLDRFWIVGNGNQILVEGMLEDLWGTAAAGYGLLTGGQEIKITRSTGCGCGSKLKTQNPFGIRLTMYPMPKKRSVGV